MSDRAQRVLDALIEYKNDFWHDGLPLQAIYNFLDNYKFGKIFYSEMEEDYESLTINEEKQVIKAFLEDYKNE